MPTPSTRFADKANLKALFAGLKAKYEPKDATIVKDASYVHSDNNYSDADKAKLDGIDEGATAYEHPTHSAQTGKPTADQTPAFGASFTVSQVTSDGYGHVTGMVDRDVTIPSTEATTAAAGLMSATDKAKLDGFDSASEYVKTGDDASLASVTATGEVTATEGTGASAVTHNLTEKLDADRYRGQQTWGDLYGSATWGSLIGTNVTSDGDTETENIELTKMAYDSTVDVAKFNENMDKIDAAIAELQSIADADGVGF